MLTPAYGEIHSGGTRISLEARAETPNRLQVVEQSALRTGSLTSHRKKTSLQTYNTEKGKTHIALSRRHLAEFKLMDRRIFYKVKLQ